MRPLFGFDRTVARSALRFGLPLAIANMLSWALLNVDNVVISRTSGVVALGFYVLAFNVSSWPMTAIGRPSARSPWPPSPGNSTRTPHPRSAEPRR